MTPTGLLITGSLVGGLLGLGLAVVVRYLPLLRRPSLEARLAPYVADVLPESRLLVPHGVGSAVPVLQRLVARGARRVAARLQLLLGGASSVQRRLDRAGRGVDVESFRAEQVVWGALGGLAGGVVAGALWWGRQAAPVALSVLVLAAVGGGFAARDWALTQQARRRERLMMAEFPTVAEMLALAVGAGEGPVAALERVAHLSHGELAAELRRTLADARAGASFVQALQGLSTRTDLAPLVRFVDGVVVAVERGTPLAEVLRGQAQDVREAGHRELTEAAGRKEIAMMVPVVFGVLPVTVLFAVYPGFAFLRMGW
ncbi:type II secretion system F family protein [Angustibacter sp. Root456]|uniref:type II secretion system F family protein n=1 Tax=Angustibacter sp. Root456 TaxID=1736539 RepID=UPI0006F29B18|nr:type II secretion system F family protein [Angustibacter sp. Root456]KQX65654.1 pilus assembly protein TadB [Angustibacter sp. Root456]